MRLLLAVAVLFVTFGLSAAFAQSDRTMGINCTVAGHIHCGENGPIFGSSSYGRRHWHGHRAYAYAGDCRVIRHRIETPSGRVLYRSRRVCG